ncbi:DnaJ domain-containing protein [Arenimonas sp. MALMAid1274]|uniref:DnaJ domain-containing protein n=1 Tax=Arenimonas sp. MALMAid1274 TaxID=3411630 RepID=UPI003B9FD0A5
MIESRGHALEQALAYYRAPALLSMAAQRPLPEDVLDLLRLAAGDDVLAEQQAEASGETAGVVVDAAVFFVQQVLFAPGADSHRVLGVNADAPEARIKEHYRWLVRWLHPDRNQDDWDNVYAERVNRAWQDLRRRGAGSGVSAAVPAVVPRTAPPAGVVAPPARVRIDHADAAAPMISSRTAQRLPAIVLGGLGMLAGATLMLMWYARPTSSDEELIFPRVADASEGPQESPLDAMVFAPAPPPPALDAGAQAAASAPGIGSGDEAAAGATPPSETVAPVIPVAPHRTAPAPLAAASAVATPRAAPEVPPAPAGAASFEPGRAAQVAAAAIPRTTARAAEPRAALGDDVSVRATQAPVVATATADTTPAQAAATSEAAGRAVARRFTDAYGQGDINALMRLFTRDARNDRGGRDAIVYDYQSLFSGSHERSLALDPSGWIARDDGATLITRYEARVKMRGKLRTTVSRGGLRFDLRQEGGELRISKLSLEDDAD